ncbi:hypothetical protein FPRO06_13004 [Fusarium proliferatum]|nr:hypothetical protein FPRO06_13004 [Fusarium proliferatum]CVL11695.1 uncharacterized protein FPRN_14929 [Fusarium proliferatum]
MFAETVDHQQYIIVDIDRSQETAVKDISRYYVQYPTTSATSWVKHEVPVDIESGNYQSCVGRVSNGVVDGVYTMGTAGASSQLVYVPLYNPFGGPAIPSRLSLPDNVQASAIASSRNIDTSTDLYAISGSSLYYFASDSQTDGAMATLLMDNTLFSGTTELSAMMHQGSTTIWGRNSSDQVYYISCPSDQVQNIGAWSVPIPLLSDVERISSYLNCSDGGNTIFAFGANKLQRLVQASETTEKLWSTDGIRLVAQTPTSKSQPFNSYTTTIHTNDSNNLPVNGAFLELTTASRVSVYINGFYFILSLTPTRVVTDATGSVTIVELVDGTISGTVLTVTCNEGSSCTVINPMNKAFQTIAQLSDVPSLQQATFVINVTAGGVMGKPTSSPLVAPPTSTADLGVVADSITNLKSAYSSANSPGDSFPPPTTAIFSGTSAHPMPANSNLAAPSQSPPSLALSFTISDEISIAAGDLYRAFKSGIKHSIEFIHDVATAEWHLLAIIGGKVYRAVLNSVSAITGAVEWVFNAVKTGIHDIIRFVEFLFEWDDISRTKDVLHNMALQWISAKAGGIEAAKTAFDDQVSNIEAHINTWAGINDWTSSIGSIAGRSTSSGSANPSSRQTPGSQMLASHYKNHGGSLTITGAQPSIDSAQQVIEDLLSAIELNGSSLSPLYSGLKTLAADFSSMTLGEVLAKLAAILADEAINGVKAVLNAVFDVLGDLSSTALTLLTVKIHIPVISDILNDIGVPEISFLDLFCWIPAVAYTVIYKICNNAPPFPDNTEVQKLIHANSWEDIQKLLVGGPQQVSGTVSKSSASDSQQTLTNGVSFIAMDMDISSGFGKLSLDTAKALCTAGNAIAGFMSFFSGFVEAFEAEIPEGEENPWSIPATVIGILEAASGAIAEAALPKDPIDDEGLEIISDAITTGNIVAGLIFCGPAQKYLRARNPTGFLVAEDGRATRAVIDVFFAAMATCVTIGHFVELGNEAANSDRTDAILGESANLASYVARVSYCVAVNDPDKETMQLALIAMVVAKSVTAGLQTAQAI